MEPWENDVSLMFVVLFVLFLAIRVLPFRLIIAHHPKFQNAGISGTVYG